LSGKGAFDIYVDPEMDPDIGEILVIRKRPSKIRGGLGDVGWGVNVDDVPPVPKLVGLDEKTNLNLGVKPKGDEKEGGKERWWTIGRGRKDSKEKEETKKKGKENVKISSSLERKCFFRPFVSSLVLTILLLSSSFSSCGTYT
jgi:hypothetical protein